MHELKETTKHFSSLDWQMLLKQVPITEITSFIEDSLSWMTPPLSAEVIRKAKANGGYPLVLTNLQKAQIINTAMVRMRQVMRKRMYSEDMALGDRVEVRYAFDFSYSEGNHESSAELSD